MINKLYHIITDAYLLLVGLTFLLVVSERERERRRESLGKEEGNEGDQVMSLKFN